MVFVSTFDMRAPDRTVDGGTPKMMLKPALNMTKYGVTWRVGSRMEHNRPP